MKNLLPQVKRRRVFIEGFYNVEVDRSLIERFFNELAETLSMVPITKPMIFSPDSRKHPIHKGLAGYMGWVESGVSLYTWREFKFFTVDIYTCKDFDLDRALKVIDKFLIPSSIVTEEFRYEG
ncbi:S-adenosylmethionine decarboxylase [Candidatus Bathyarchaeota archaeon]|nr:S-adenosylmethionine decarboxylase [Candidatus Bathyarchaeota archaeon]